MTQRILVADDEEEIRFMLALHLERDGYEVVSVANGRDAIARIQSEVFDVVLCDLVMPEADGIELIRAARGFMPDLPIVLMSAHADVDTALSAVEDGAFDYISKPFRIDEVLFRLRRATQQRALQARVSQLEEVLVERSEFKDIVARSEPMQVIFQTIRKVADYKTTVLLTGESGTGKELVARALHFSSVRRDEPFIAVNCGAIPENLLETELFGHVRGAFTDANSDRKGLFEQANGGTLFLDEIGELLPPLQVKILRVLQENEIRRVGDSKNIPVNVRIIAATVRDLVSEVESGTFREDLFYRLNVLPIRLPSLRERSTDIPLLVSHFLHQFNESLGTAIQPPDPDVMRILQTYHWPGNVRELENTIERAVVLCDGARIVAADLPEKIQASQDELRTILSSDELSIKKTARFMEEQLIRKALERTDGNRTHAAELLEISHRALLYKIKEYGIKHPPKGQR